MSPANKITLGKEELRQTLVEMSDKTLGDVAAFLHVTREHVRNLYLHFGITRTRAHMRSVTRTLLDKFSKEKLVAESKLAVNGMDLARRLKLHYRHVLTLTRYHGLPLPRAAHRLREDGKKKCGTCKKVKVISEFSIGSDRWDKLQPACKQCNKAWAAGYWKRMHS